ncbi:MAG: hypothetical protein HYX90_02335, partial [Chloroflexi bacterium]|nr:hypothetical protein [Chloroflexota bacterium]
MQSTIRPALPQGRQGPLWGGRPQGRLHLMVMVIALLAQLAITPFATG